MKILQVARYGSVKGGTEAYVRELSRGLREAGHDVALAYRFDPDASRPEVAAGRLLNAITSTNPIPAGAERDEVRALVEEFKPDIIHAHNVEAAWLPGALAQAAPVLVGVHDHRLDCPTGTRYWAGWGRACDVAPGGRCLGFNVAAHCGSLKANATLEPYRRWRRLHAAATDGPAIQVFSDYMRDVIAKAGVRAPVTVTPYPCPEPFAPSELGPEDWRPVVLAAGRVTKEKGFDLLIDSLAHVGAPVHAVIGGEGHHLEALKRHAGRVPSRHRVTFAGWLDGPALAAWFARATIFAMPSAWPEPFGIVGLEAMAAGLPVVATNSGGVRTWLDDGVTGVAVQPRDPAAFGRAIARLIADPGLRARMGAAGIARAATQFAVADHIEKIVELYQRIRRGWEVAA